MPESFEELIRSDKPVLIDFWATWCGPCKAMMPALDALEVEAGERVRVVKMDVGQHLDLAVSLKVMGVPTLMIYQHGRLLWSEAGVQSKEQLLQILDGLGI